LTETKTETETETEFDKSLLDTPRIERVGHLWVVRDDLLPGGTKYRALLGYLQPRTEYVYASPAYGYAQVALAYAARDIGAKATVFVAQRKERHKLTLVAESVGATIVEVPFGYLSNVQHKAMTYATGVGAVCLPFGFRIPEISVSITAAARSLGITPTDVWSVAGSGTLSLALQEAWPEAACHAVRIGALPPVGRATLYVAPERFEQAARVPPPFPSCENYDAKAWRFLLAHAGRDSVFWNVAA
jgi:hypothetical protein